MIKNTQTSFTKFAIQYSNNQLLVVVKSRHHITTPDHAKRKKKGPLRILHRRNAAFKRECDFISSCSYMYGFKKMCVMICCMIHETCMIPFSFTILLVLSDERAPRRRREKNWSGALIPSDGSTRGCPIHCLALETKAPISSQWRHARQKADNGPCSAASRLTGCVRSLTAWSVASTCGCKSARHVMSAWS